jgi:hypothetical protein
MKLLQLAYPTLRKIQSVVLKPDRIASSQLRSFISLTDRAFPQVRSFLISRSTFWKPIFVSEGYDRILPQAQSTVAQPLHIAPDKSPP